jgi:hypothetical protein
MKKQTKKKKKGGEFLGKATTQEAINTKQQKHTQARIET